MFLVEREYLYFEKACTVEICGYRKNVNKETCQNYFYFSLVIDYPKTNLCNDY